MPSRFPREANSPPVVTIAFFAGEAMPEANADNVSSVEPE
jgi:hypothetical protein